MIQNSKQEKINFTKKYIKFLHSNSYGERNLKTTDKLNPSSCNSDCWLKVSQLKIVGIGNLIEKFREEYEQTLRKKGEANSS